MSVTGTVKITEPSQNVIQQATLMSAFWSKIETENPLYLFIEAGLFSMHLTHYTVFIFNPKITNHAEYSEDPPNIVLH